ncbi:MULTISPECIES: acyl-CoA dehydrogenase [Paenibacillus]|jgi:alkylation response protein AidB-like acyl-CoA dehydrogenase|uniref:Acyl-CoA dehydrogenase type 2 domain protein n=1 Tax=Paenibacillus lactis 154 TaxID=743719 RepID=G4HJL1_9BACL|nr:acyl-CoA dehydrogenase [Paenibacillus lactis]EHB62465.1 Acyl-CoA dehydrogenase type 2 domain protein [Paenibacillus lactis 154]MCM3492277.1 acyl-CoA dehydrogenase [Paenibacillus lactis]
MLYTQQLIDSVRQFSLEMDKFRRIPKEVLDFIYDERLFHLFVPDELEGRMTALPEAARLFQACSRIDGNLGWMVTIGAGGGFFAALLEQDVSREIFARRDAVIAGSGMPTGTARRVEGGYRVSGRWKYCSGSTYATTFTANAVIDSGNESAKASELPSGAEAQEIRAFAFRPEQIRILPDWNAFGLRATASHTMIAEDVFVPDNRTFLFDEMKSYEHEAIYRYPFLPFAQVSFAAVAIGIAEHFLAAAEALAEAKGSEAYVMDKLKEHSGFLRDGEVNFYETVETSWRELLQQGKLSVETEAAVTTASIGAANTARTCGQTLFPLLGLTAAMEDSEVNRCWRDLQTACSHSLLRSYA